jgi:hypothetical protein
MIVGWGRGETRVIEPRIYRAAFIPALLALVLVMFSLESRPPPLSQGLAADVLFDARRATTDMRDIARSAPDRKPGSIGNQRTAARVAEELAALGFRTEIDRFRAEGTSLVNVVARRGGGSASQVLVIAGRDADSVPDASTSAADTAALLELARVIQGKVAEKTLVLASVDGSTLGDAGVRRLVERLEPGPRTDAALVLSNMGAKREEGPLLVAWSNDDKRGGLGLQRTALASLRQELGSVPGDPGATEQLSRLAFPLGLGGQAPLLARGIDAIRLSGSGELPPTGAETPEDVDVGRFGDLGRGALRTLFALEEGGAPEHGPSSYVTFSGQVLPGWALSLLALCLILPALVASIDAFARVRRRREPVMPYWRWLGAGMLAFLAALGVGEFLVLVGQAPDPPPGPPMPGDAAVDGAALASLCAVAMTLTLGLVLARVPVLRRANWPPPAEAAGAGCAVALAMSVATLVVWMLNPYTALLLVPAMHLWLLAGLTAVRWRAALAMVLGGLLPIAIVGLLYLNRLDLDPVEGAWYLFQLFTGGQVGVLAALMTCVLLGIAVSAIGVATARRHVPEPEDREPHTGRPRDELPPIFGPGGHAGPGMIGGPAGTGRR